MADPKSSGQSFSIDKVDFDAVYRGEAALENESFVFEGVPWDIGEPQPVLVELERAGGLRGHVLDIGCGTGDNATFLAGRGHQVTGVDGSPTAINLAKERAAGQSVDVEFIVGDATRLDGISQRFDTVLDSALYHCLPDDARAAYGAALHRVSKPGARLHLFCFTDELPDSIPFPGRVSQDNLRANLAQHWNITRIDAARYSGAFTTEAVQRLFTQIHVTDFDPASLRTDDHGRITFPVWHLEATRA